MSSSASAARIRIVSDVASYLCFFMFFAMLNHGGLRWFFHSIFLQIPGIPGSLIWTLMHWCFLLNIFSSSTAPGGCCCESNAGIRNNNDGCCLCLANFVACCGIRKKNDMKDAVITHQTSAIIAMSLRFFVTIFTILGIVAVTARRNELDEEDEYHHEDYYDEDEDHPLSHNNIDAIFVFIFLSLLFGLLSFIYTGIWYNNFGKENNANMIYISDNDGIGDSNNSSVGNVIHNHVQRGGDNPSVTTVTSGNYTSVPSGLPVENQMQNTLTTIEMHNQNHNTESLSAGES